MKELHDLRNFKDLDSLVSDDYISGKDNYSLGILKETAGFLVENAVTVDNSPFDDVYIVNEEKIKSNPGMANFIKNLKTKSLRYLNDVLSKNVYIFDGDEYQVYMIGHAFKDGGIKYGWKINDRLNDGEISFFERARSENEPASEARKKHAAGLYKSADFDFLASETKNKSQVLDYEGEDDKTGVIYVLKSERAGSLVEKLKNLDEESLNGLYTAMNKRLFIKDAKNDVYSLEAADGTAAFVRNDAVGGKYSIIVSSIKLEGSNDMYG